ncbi:MAG: sigma-70 family RNA polymerase sigma factor [Actinomycetota bacterium]
MARDRDEDFEIAFDDLLPRCMAAARRLLPSTADAEDVAAEALARTYAHWRKVRSLSYRDAWVMRVVINLATDAARRKPPLVSPPEAVNVEESVTLRLGLVAALRLLPRRQREAIGLRYLGGFSEAEVAEALGVTQGAVKTHIHRGTAALRQRLGERTDEEVIPFGKQ